MKELPEELDTRAADIVVSKDEYYNFYGHLISDMAQEYIQKEFGIPDDKTTFEIHVDPMMFVAALPGTWTIGILLDDGTLGLIIPSALH